MFKLIGQDLFAFFWNVRYKQDYRDRAQQKRDKMPWEKSFDIDAAIQEAMVVFWRKGYEATSITDLTKAMGINKGSLYNAFGNKKALFDRALLTFDKQNRQKTLSYLSTVEDGHAAIVELFDGLVAESQADKDHKGCLLVNTALDLPNQPDDVKDMVTKALAGFEDFFKETILRGQSYGTIPSSVDPEPTSKSLLSTVIGLRVLARGTFGEEGLEAVRSEAIRAIS